jgi:hypothetical protein
MIRAFNSREFQVHTLATKEKCQLNGKCSELRYVQI